MTKKKSEDKPNVIVVASTPEDEASITALMDSIDGAEDGGESEDEPVTAENFDDKIREELQKNQGESGVEGFEAASIIKERLSGLPCFIGGYAPAVVECSSFLWLAADALDIKLDRIQPLDAQLFARSGEELAVVLNRVLTAANFEHHFGGLVVFLHAVDRRVTNERPGYPGLEIKFYYGAKAPRR